LDPVRGSSSCSVDVAVPEGVSSLELGLRLVAVLTNDYGAVVTDVTYTADGHPTYSVRLNAARPQEAAGVPSLAPADIEPRGRCEGDIAQSGA